MTSNANTRPVRDLLAYAFGILGSKGLLFIGTPLLTRLLGDDDYGRVALSIAVAGILAAVTGFGSEAAYNRFYFLAEGESALRTLTRTWVLFLAVSTAVPIIPSLVFRDYLAARLFGEGHEWLPVLTAIAVVPTVLGFVVIQALRNDGRAPEYTALLLGTAGFQLTMAVAAAAAGLGAEGVIGSILVAETVALALKYWRTQSYFGGEFDTRVLRSVLRYGIPLIPASLSGWIYTSVDRVMLGAMVSQAEVGVYTVAVFAAQPTLLALAAFGQAWEPIALRRWQETSSACEPLVRATTSLLIAAVGGLAVLLAVLAEPLFRVMAPASFARGTSAVLPLALGGVFIASARATSAPLTFHLRSRSLASVMAAAAVVNVGANLVLIPPFGLHGAAWATTISYGVLAVLYPILSARVGFAAVSRSAARETGILAALGALAWVNANRFSGGSQLIMGVFIGCAAIAWMLVAVRRYGREAFALESRG